MHHVDQVSIIVIFIIHIIPAHFKGKFIIEMVKSKGFKKRKNKK